MSDRSLRVQGGKIYEYIKEADGTHKYFVRDATDAEIKSGKVKDSITSRTKRRKKQNETADKPIQVIGRY